MDPATVNFRVNIGDTEGIIVPGDPYLVNFTVEGVAGRSYTNVSVTCAAPSAGLEVTLGAAINCPYSQPGTYSLVVTIRDGNTVIYQKTNAVVVKDATAHVKLVKSIYLDMVDRLTVNNTELALNLFLESAQPKYSNIFSNLGSSVTTLAPQLGTLGSTTASNEHAEVVLTRMVGGVAQSFLIYLIRGDDGIWRIESM